MSAPRRRTELAAWPFGRRNDGRATHGLLAGLGPRGATSIPGLHAAGGLARGAHGADAAIADGTQVVAEVAARLAAVPAATDDVRDLVIVGAGPAGCAAAFEATRLGLADVLLIEAEVPLRSISTAPADQPTAAVPTAPSRALLAAPTERERRWAELSARLEAARIALRNARVQRVERGSGASTLDVVLADGDRVVARAVLLATGPCGCPRHLDVPGEHRAHPHLVLDEPAAFASQRTLVVGGGEQAAQTALRLAEAGAEVTLVHRGAMLTRPDYLTLARLSERLAGAPLEPWRKHRREDVPRRAPGPGTITLRLVSRVLDLGPGCARIQEGIEPAQEILVDAVFVRSGVHSAAQLARASGLAVRGDRPERD